MKREKWHLGGGTIVNNPVYQPIHMHE